MSFLYPAFFWGLLALTIPVIIHLFTFHKTKTIYFSAVAFIDEVKDETESRNKLKHLLILLARLLMLLFLLTAFAQPVWEVEDPLQSASGYSIYLDNSQSMSCNTSFGNSAMEEGIAIIDQVIKKQPIERKHFFLTNDFLGFSNYSRTGLEILETTRIIEYTPKARSIQSIIDRITQKDKENRNILLISDFQKSTFGKAEMEIDSTQSITLIPIQLDPSISNIFVDTAYLSKPFSISNQENQLILIFKNTGNRERQNVLIKLTQENRLLSSLTIDLPAYGSKEVMLNITASTDRDRKLTVSFEDFPVTFDNEFHMVVSSLTRPRITVINSSERNNYLEAVFSNEELFDMISFPAGKINYDRLTRSDLIILNEFDELPGWLNKDLSAKSDILIVPPETPSVGNYQNVLGKRLGISNDSNTYTLRIADIDHPFFQGLIDLSDKRIDMPLAGNSITIANPDDVLLENSMNEAFLLKIDKLSAYVFTCPLKKPYTSITEHALFLPVMYRIAQLSSKKSQTLSFDSNNRIIQVPVKSEEIGELFTLAGQGIELVPNSFVSDNALTLELPPEPIPPGFYYLISNRDTLATVAFNTSKRESLLEQYSFDDIKQLSSNNPSISVANPGTLSSLVDGSMASDLSIQLWKYALILAAIFLMVEILLVRFFK